MCQPSRREDPSDVARAPPPGYHPPLGQQRVGSWDSSHYSAPLAGAVVVSRRHMDSLSGRRGGCAIDRSCIASALIALMFASLQSAARFVGIDENWPMPFWIKEGLPLRNAFPPTHPGIRTVPRWWGGPGPTPHSYPWVDSDERASSLVRLAGERRSSLVTPRCVRVSSMCRLVVASTSSCVGFRYLLGK